MLVEAVRLERGFFAEGEARGGVLGVGLLHDPLEFVVTPRFEQSSNALRVSEVITWENGSYESISSTDTCEVRQVGI